ncbi:hypothetical protein ACVWXF_001022 [Thermostichus sp. MS-CIW-40]|jgi:hypothetical protein
MTGMPKPALRLRWPDRIPVPDPWPGRKRGSFGFVPILSCLELFIVALEVTA